jgi:hypothetical protein
MAVSRLDRRVAAVLSILAVAALSACEEKPPRADPERHRDASYGNAAPQNPVYERTVNQEEGRRNGD